MSAQPQTAISVEDLLYNPEPRIDALKPFQVRSSKHMITWAASINGMATGTGKTISVIAAVDALDLFPAQIVCGSRVALQWAGEFLHWLTFHSHLRPGLTVSLLEGETPIPFSGRHINTFIGCDTCGDRTVPVRVNDLSADVVIATYPIVYDWANELAKRGNRSLVLDEVHRVSHLRPRTKSGGNNYPMIGTYQSVACWYLGQHVVKAYGFQHIWGLSADAVVNRPKDLIGILEILGVMWRLGGRDYYRARYCSQEENVVFGHDGQVKRFYDDRGASNLKELHERLVGLGLLFRVTKKEALPDMPDNTEITIPVQLSNQVEYDRAESDLMGYVREMATIKARDLDLPIDQRDQYVKQAEYKTARAHALSRITVLRRLVGKGKADAAIEWLHDFLEENPGEKILVFVHHRSAQERILQAFPDAARILGGQSLAESDENKHRFQRDPNCTMIMVAQAAGDEGLNLSSGYYSLIVEWPWTGKAINQMLGRSNGRMDNPHAITAVFMHSAGSIDDHVRSIIQRKRKMSSMILDGISGEIQSGKIDDELLASLVEKEAHDTTTHTN